MQHINIDLKILYESESVIVFDKPFGLTVNKAESQKDNVTLQDIVVEKYPKIYLVDPSSIDEKYKDFYLRSGIVHRLDKDTSGVIIVAKDPEAFNFLQSQFKERKVEKKYVALVYGIINDVEIGETIEINAPIKRGTRNREKFMIAKDGREAETHIKIMSFHKSPEYGDYTLVECSPKSGRTHQIRVHLSALGHPVLGDSLYSGNRRYKINEHILNRQFLHAISIKFFDPSANQSVEVSSNLPEDLETVLSLVK